MKNKMLVVMCCFLSCLFAKNTLACTQIAGTWEGGWSETSCNNVQYSGRWTGEVTSDCEFTGTDNWDHITGTIDRNTFVLSGTGVSMDGCGTITLTGAFTEDYVSGSYEYNAGGSGYFDARKYKPTLSVTKNGLGIGTVISTPSGVNCGYECTASIEAGTQVSLVAVTDASSSLTEWVGCDSVVGDECMFTMDSDRDISVAFAYHPELRVSKTTYIEGLIVSSPQGIDCGSDCSEHFNYGIQVTLTASYDELSLFFNWEGCDSVADDECFVTMFSEKEVTASLNLYGHETKIAADDRASYDDFGSSVSLDGDLLAVGAPGDDGEAGSVHIFEHNEVGTNSWNQIIKLVPEGEISGDLFGNSVSIDGDNLVVGAFHDGDTSVLAGSAYIFSRNHGGDNQWARVIKLNHDDQNGGYFGQSVSMSGDIVAIGAPHPSTVRSAVFIYSRNEDGENNWGRVQKITLEGDETVPYFGESVSLNGNYLLVGASWSDDNGTWSGAAYLYSRNLGGEDNWGLLTKLISDDAASGDYFGKAVSISGDHLVIGALNDDDNGFDSGSAYVFSRNQGGIDNWGQVTKLTPEGEQINAHFGDSVAIYGDVVAVGVPNDADFWAGTVYIFFRHQGGENNWGQLEKISPDDGRLGDQFGTSVAIDGQYLATGAPWNDSGGAFSGATYLYTQKAQPESVSISGDTTFDLTDIILGLQILTNVAPSESVDVNADINNNNKIGLEEIIYSLEQSSQ